MTDLREIPIASGESFADQLSRLRQMADGDQTWDLSENDMAAIAAILENRQRLIDALQELERAIDGFTRGEPFYTLNRGENYIKARVAAQKALTGALS